MGNKYKGDPMTEKQLPEIFKTFSQETVFTTFVEVSQKIEIETDTHSRKHSSFKN